MILRDALRQKALRTLEFDRVREFLAALTSFPPSRELALELNPSYEAAEVGRLQQETRDALRLLDMRPNLALDDAKDIRRHVQAAGLGGVLTGPELIEVADTLAAMHFLQATLLRVGESLPSLAVWAGRLTEHREIEATIRRTMTSQGEVMDGASDTLRYLRAEGKAAQSRLTARIQEIAAAATARQALQEPFVTTRDGRYVLAVKSEMRGQVQGLIHDISSSGATVFMEPLAAVEMGNAWRELQLAERREVERIIRELCSLIGEHGEAIKANLEVLTRVDMALAKARMAKKMNAMLPQLLGHRAAQHRDGDQGETPPGGQAGATAYRLLGARHPLLKGNVVPISVEIGKDFQALVISGPNTGGKTVALKTVGLLALMSQAGLAVPAEAGSAIRISDGVFADIGDEQSIEQSLSTFSSHMSTIVQILRVVTDRSLVLLDELGAGTDPAEGSAIAKAVLSTLLRVGASAVITTHHSELKAFAHNNPGFQNANVEFDPVTLAPTYRLVVGLPGRSNALAIAERLGLPGDIVEEARRSLGPAAAEVDALLREIQEQRQAAEQERTAAERLRKELEEAQAAFAERLQQFEADERRRAMLRRAEVQVLAEELKSRLRHVSRRVNSLLGEHGKKEMAQLYVELNDVSRKLDSRELNPPVPEARKPQEPLKPGERILVEGMDTPAEVLAGPDKNRMVDVQVGQMRMRVPQERIKGKDRKPQPVVRKVFVAPGISARAQVGAELWVHGMRAQQAVEAVDEYLEKAALAGHERIRIIHGKGRGILRNAIHEFLGDNPLVGTFRDADPGEGGEGVTVVEF